jgi:hypothetical protein
MIFRKSTDPIFIKKIALEIWSLRDEVEAIIEEKIASLGRDLTPEEIDQIKLQYQKTTVKPTLVLVEEAPAAPANPDEAAAAAPADGEAAAATTPPVLSVVEGAANDGKIYIDVEIPKLIESKRTRARSVLSEINMDKMYLFSNESFIEGQAIRVRFLVPKEFIITGIVHYCRIFSNASRIISENRFPYRTAIRFTFDREGERTLLREFLTSVEPDLNHIAVAAAATAAAENNTDLSELDELDT